MTRAFLRKRDSSSSVPSIATDSSALPSYVLRAGADRLAALALIYAIVYFIAAYVLPDPAGAEDVGGRLWDILGYMFIGLSLVLYVLIKTGRLRTQHLQAGTAFAFEIFGAIGIEMGLLFWTGDPAQIPLGLSWTAVWIVAFPFLFPSTPVRTMWAAFFAASIRPLFLGILALQGVPMPELATVIQFVAPTYLCVGIAVVASSVVYGLGRDVSRARRMGSYRLVKRLGEGGMGEVWTAEHRLLARPAAIKLMRVGSPNDPAREVHRKRFEREVQATAQLHSPHTIEIYDFGNTEDGTFYYVMELLDGLDLDDLVRRFGKLQPSRVVHILRQVCHSLGEAHDRGMVHRDIKPANIFLCRSGRDIDFVKVLDFGLVKGEEIPATAAHLTQAGTFYGTPAFTSPELARAEADAVDARSDIYSLGCVAFWLLTGRQVFEAGHPMGVLIKHSTEEPDPPSRHAAVPEDLDAIVLRCLRKAKSERFQTVDELAERLMECQYRYPWSVSDAQAWWETYEFHEATTVDDAEVATTSIAPGTTVDKEWESASVAQGR